MPCSRCRTTLFRRIPHSPSHLTSATHHRHTHRALVVPSSSAATKVARAEIPIHQHITTAACLISGAIDGQFRRATTTSPCRSSAQPPPSPRTCPPSTAGDRPRPPTPALLHSVIGRVAVCPRGPPSILWFWWRYTLWNAEYRVSLMRKFENSRGREQAVKVASGESEVVGEEGSWTEEWEGVGCSVEVMDIRVLVNCQRWLRAIYRSWRKNWWLLRRSDTTRISLFLLRYVQFACLLIEIKYRQNALPLKTSGKSRENQDQPSPISVLEATFSDDINIDDLQSFHAGNPQALSRSPLIGSLARSISWDNTRFQASLPKTKYKSILMSKEDRLVFVQKLLSSVGIDGMKSTTVLAQWHSLDCPLDPMLLEGFLLRKRRLSVGRGGPTRSCYSIVSIHQCLISTIESSSLLTLWRGRLMGGEYEMLR